MIPNMSKPRFFCDQLLHPHSAIELPDKLAHYTSRVLRLKNGSAIVLFDGRGGEYSALLDYRGKQAFAHTLEHDPREAELPGHIHLVQGLAAADKMDWIVEKAVELGARSVIPVTAQRSVLQLRGDRLEKRVQHWQRITQSASEQCGRNRIMGIDMPSPLSSVLPRLQGFCFLCHPDFGIPLTEAITKLQDDVPASLLNSTEAASARINLLVGPEGGWSDQETDLALQQGAQAVRFGPRVLRTETAGLALLAACVALLGWNDV